VTLLKVGVAVVLVLTVVFLGVAAVLPDKFSYAQSTTIKGDLDDVHAQVGDFRHWNDWNPWLDEDPEMKSTYSETTNQVGSWLKWTGPKIGEVKMQFTKVSQTEGIEYRFWFGDDESGTGGLKYEKVEGAINVTWWWKGDAGYPLERWIHTLFARGINDSFAKGLGKIKANVEPKP
jgi:hypothetical protein